ncbi:MAG: SH3 domain-containing protein [Anaerolineae bacterium]|nr:SH3 domain-containing protein [Anaerolineae bacterium]
MTRKVVEIVSALLLFSVILVQPAAAQGPVWVGQYYDNSTLSGTAAVTRNEGAISFNWGAGSPSSGIPGDGFSARFATDYVFPAGTYRFYMLADDEARVTINFQPIPLINTLNQGRAGQTVSADVQLNGATHVQIDYVEITGDAYLYLSWSNLASNPQGPNFIPPVNVPINTSAWTVQYYSNPNLLGDPAAILTESAPGRDWGTGSPLASIPADNWSARWTSTQNLNAGQYQISVRADDGVRVYVNGGLIINQFGTATGDTYSTSLNLPQGNNNFVIEYVEYGGLAYLDYRLTQFNPTVATPIPVGPQPVTGATLTVTGAFRLNVRSAPSVVDGAILTRINRNETYPITGRNLDGTWYQINVNGQSGWVSARFATPYNATSVPVVNGSNPPADQGGGSNTGLDVTATPYTVNIRQGPGTQFSRLGRLPAGRSAQLLGRNAANQWYQVNYNGIVGWVSAEYVVLPAGANVNSVPVVQ